jgi:N6-L-threonylcarbamoyladenine synthase
MLVLGIETSCDETAAAVVAESRRVLSSVINSQVELHGPYGGVVPEIASRSHVESLPGVVDEAIRLSGVGWGDIDAVAVTHGPGLASSLLVGLSAAKGLALSLGVRLCAINHIEAHIYSLFLADGAPSVEEACPFAALVVSGGHTCLVRVEGLGKYVLLGQTMDDAAGEAFDKGAKLLGLGYPGGPVMDRVSRGGNPRTVRFPRGRQKPGWTADLDPDLCFSFSGLKTALLYHLRDNPVAAGNASDSRVADVAASYQQAIVDALIGRCEHALRPTDRCLGACGGVSLNSRLRSDLADLAKRKGIRLLLAEPKHCGDNAAMIAGLASAGRGLWDEAAFQADAEPSLPLC